MGVVSSSSRPTRIPHNRVHVGLKDLERIYARKRNATTGELISQMELIQPGEPFPYTYRGPLPPTEDPWPASASSEAVLRIPAMKASW